MLVLIILLIISAGLNVALLFCRAISRADEEMQIIRLREGLKVK